MKKQIIRLTEQDLRKVIKESVKRIINEIERSHPGDIPPGDEDIYYPGDINPDVWDSLSRGDYGEDDYDIDDYAEDRIDLMANYDDFPPMRNESKNKKKILETNLAQIRKSNKGPKYNSHRVLEDEGFYVCVDTIYGEGVYAWIGNLKDAKQIDRSSEGYALGPFKTYREAATAAKRKGLTLSMK